MNQVKNAENGVLIAPLNLPLVNLKVGKFHIVQQMEPLEKVVLERSNLNNSFDLYGSMDVLKIHVGTNIHTIIGNLFR